MTEFTMEVIVLGVILLLFVPVVVAMVKRKDEPPEADSDKE
jgi:hypothetical protein